MAYELQELLEKMFRARASDLHLSAGNPPSMRVDGELVPMDLPELTAEQVRTLVQNIVTKDQNDRLAAQLEIDFSFAVPGLCRFRANLFHQRGTLGAVFRVIPMEVPDFATLQLPAVVAQLARRPRGLILVTGATGSGKSTTLAAMLEYLNRTTQQHILTIEDPIEFVHPRRQCVVNQREVGSDTHGFAEALRVALREDPDVVLIGEMRDLETIESALRIAETGHLTLATLHTNSAASTIHRIVDVFPPHQQPQIRAQLALVLEGILCQTLLPRIGGGRCMAMEILVPTSAVRNLIREDKIHQIYSAMQIGQDKHGMQTFNQSLLELTRSGALARHEALAASSLPDELLTMLQRGGAPVHEPGRPVAVRA